MSLDCERAEAVFFARFGAVFRAAVFRAAVFLAPVFRAVGRGAAARGACAACHIASMLPSGSEKMVNHPIPCTSCFDLWIRPPAAVTRFSFSARSPTLT